MPERREEVLKTEITKQLTTLDAKCIMHNVVLFGTTHKEGDIVTERTFYLEAEMKNPNELVIVGGKVNTKPLKLEVSTVDGEVKVRKYRYERRKVLSGTGVDELTGQVAEYLGNHPDELAIS